MAWVPSSRSNFWNLTTRSCHYVAKILLQYTVYLANKAYEPRHAKKALSVAVTYNDDSLIRDTFAPGRYFQINKFSGLLNRPSVQERKSVPALFVDTCLLESVSLFKTFVTSCKLTQQKSVEFQNKYQIVTERCIWCSWYKITEAKLCMLLRKCHDMILDANNTAAYTPCLWPHRKLILTAILLKFSQINLKMMYIQKIWIQNKHFDQNTLRALFARRGSYLYLGLYSW